MTKDTLRRRLRAARRDLAAPPRDAAQHQIDTRLAGLPELAGLRYVLGYVAFRHEVDPRPTLDRLRAAGTTIGVPRIESQGLVPTRIDDWRALVPGAFGIPTSLGPPLPRLDAVLVPGVGFTEDGWRLGYGGGFYDRLLSSHPRATRIGLAFGCQLVPHVPTEAHDQCMDVVVCETGIVRCSRES